MHYLPDTNDEESLQERYWPDSFKKTIREVIRSSISARLKDSDLENIYRRNYTMLFNDVPKLRESILNAVVIGAENGADEGFERVYNAFINETPLPEIFRRVRPVWPFRISTRDRRKIHRAIVVDYLMDDGFNYAFRDGYRDQFVLFSSFIDAVAKVLVDSMENGINITLEQLYIAFLRGLPIPVIRRNPRRLKTW